MDLSFLSPLQDLMAGEWGIGRECQPGTRMGSNAQALPDLNKHLIKISLVFNIAFSIPKS